MKINDHVSVIDEDLSGIITSVHGNDVVFRDSHGFTHKYRTQNLVIRNDSVYEGILIEKKKEVGKSVSKKHQKNHMLLDLHFEKLVGDTSGYSSFERIFIQKERLLQTLEFCRKNHIKKIEIIHGIGDGTLQKMVFDVLEAQTDLEFHNKEILHHQSGTVLVYLK